MLDNLGALDEREGKYAAAEPLAQQSLAIDEAPFGPAHPETATNFNNLAHVLQRRGPL